MASQPCRRPGRWPGPGVDGIPRHLSRRIQGGGGCSREERSGVQSGRAPAAVSTTGQLDHCRQAPCMHVVVPTKRPSWPCPPDPKASTHLSRGWSGRCQSSWGCCPASRPAAGSPPQLRAQWPPAQAAGPAAGAGCSAAAGQRQCPADPAPCRAGCPAAPPAAPTAAAHSAPWAAPPGGSPARGATARCGQAAAPTGCLLAPPVLPPAPRALPTGRGGRPRCWDPAQPCCCGCGCRRRAATQAGVGRWVAGPPARVPPAPPGCSGAAPAPGAAARAACRPNAAASALLLLQLRSTGVRADAGQAAVCAAVSGKLNQTGTRCFPAAAALRRQAGVGPPPACRPARRPPAVKGLHSGTRSWSRLQSGWVSIGKLGGCGVRCWDGMRELRRSAPSRRSTPRTAGWEAACYACTPPPLHPPDLRPTPLRQPSARPPVGKEADGALACDAIAAQLRAEAAGVQPVPAGRGRGSQGGLSATARPCRDCSVPGRR